jgi:hypothetical protein
MIQSHMKLQLSLLDISIQLDKYYINLSYLKP